MEEVFNEAFELMQELMDDSAVPKTIKIVMKDVITIINDCCDVPIKCDKAIQALTITEDPNIDMFTKSRIWSLLSIFESLSQ
ncbi:MAG TPA: UPF0147 family protein [Candidatus Nanoarchaeia archaeon]|nr:UPF0147 family protein [Candidatus Nanoarchaeia archaeon]